MVVDALVDSIAAYNPRPLWAHAYAGPFALLYLVWGYAWVYVYGLDDHFEIGCIVMAAIGLFQVLVVLFCHWFVGIRCLLTCTAVADPTKAKIVKVVPTPNNGWAEVVPLRKSKMTNGKTKLWFEFQKVHYIYDDEEKKQFRAVEFSTERPMEYYQESKGLETDALIQEAIDEYGDNHMEMAVPQFMDLFKERATAPFFVFQVFCVALWCLDEMWYYSVFTLAMLVTFEATLVRQQLRNMAEIRNMGNKPYLIHAYRNKRWNRIKTDDLVPGDIVSICRSPDEHVVPCDLLLLRGPCIVDESMLTGESVPQMKEPIQELEKDRYFDLDSDSRLHVLSGGTRVVQHSSPAKNEPGLKAPDGGCICYVLRTGFNTSQGKLLRTIMFGVKRVTANNLETFGFILFLLIFAVAASAYVWIKGSQDESRNKYKLFLECTLILTSVVPPELPIELSLAVNNSLIALQKLGVFCTEPFRIPFAGKIDVCCFDKTGTLTTDNLVVEGIAGIPGANGEKGVKSSPLDVPPESIQILVACHSLVKLDEDLVGDPLEQACLTWAEWNLTKNDTVIPQKSKMLPLKIHHRFHFSSAMKRMTVIAGYMVPGTSESRHIACVKGAPETLKEMFAAVPKDYDETYQHLTRQGARVLALGMKEIGSLTYADIREMKREDVEKGLNFAGFVVISCPLKVDSKAMVKEIIDSSHRVVMITGDNALTACHVAKVLRFTKKSMDTLILDQDKDNEWNWVSVDGSKVFPVVPGKSQKTFLNEYEFCLTGPAFAYLLSNEYQFLKKLLLRVKVFARMAPKQKERIITELKSLGKVTLMCGDGTNDVGALKHADVGVALLSHPFDPSHASHPLNNPPIDKNSPATPEQQATNQPRRRGQLPSNPAMARRQDAPIGARQRTAAAPTAANKKLEQLMKEMEEEEKAQVVRLGDASIAAPFASKISSIQSICHVIKQGRCTLVTTLQMFKILALNALVLAYGQSVLYLDGIKFSDSQATIQGLLLAACFLFVSRSKPLRTLSKQRPITNIFNVYTLFTVTGQFFVHFCCLLYLVQEAHVLEPKAEKVDLESTFKPSLLNTTVYIMSVALQVSTFAVNYRVSFVPLKLNLVVNGQPFMESLWENKAMLYSVVFSGGSIFLLAAGVAPEMSEKFELVAIPTDFRNIVLMVLALDLILCFVIDRILNFVFGDARA